MNCRLSVLGLATTVALGLAAPAADADIFIGLQQDAGPIVTVDSSATGLVLNFTSFGNFSTVLYFGLGDPVVPSPLLLQSGISVSNTSGGDAGTLTVYVSSTDNTDPVGVTGIRSGLSTTNLTEGWSETLETFIDPGNAVFGLTTFLDSQTFLTSGGINKSTVADVGAGPYSKTAVYRITAPTDGGSTAAVSITAEAIRIPEPASLALIGAALTGFGIIARRQRRRR